MRDSIREDLESLTGKLIQGPLTASVYELLKDSSYKKDILEYGDLISKEKLKEAQEKTQETKEEEVEVVDSFEAWLRENSQLVR